MSNVVTFSGRSVNMDDSPVAEVQGMTPERQRELLMASGLGKMVLLSDGAEFAFPPKKSPPPMTPPGAGPSGPPAPPPPQQKAPHVAIHVHAPGGSPDGNAPPPMGGPLGMPGDPSAMPMDDDQPDPDKTAEIEAFLQTLPDDLTIDDLQDYFENMPSDEDEEGGEEDQGNPPPAKKGGPPQFSMTALEMFKRQ